MKDYIRNQRGRMFESDFFEFFSKVHPATPFIFWIPIGAGMLAYALVNGLTTVAQAAPILPLGFFTWQIAEYFIHKNVFHTWPGPTAHGFHHKYPDDDTRLVMPLPVSIGLSLIIGGGLYLLHRPELTIPFYVGMLFGYLWYDFTHWSTHHREPLTEWGRRQRAHHMAHHFGDHEKNFGLSHMWMDRLLGTLNKRTAEKK
ncbi:MAG: sterol desaturase family protein [Archangium sp.]